MSLNKEQVQELIQAARRVSGNSYSPYSGFKVGAALLGKSGRIYSGCNFENAAFGAGTCAERVALGAAVSAGEREFIALAVCGGDTPITPCGICRQALSEFGAMEVYCAALKGEETQKYSLLELLPQGFKLEV
ncbi:MAG: cytidine deaminase [Oscillospiraceae bacterium]|jgi:cytidine deaminase|nr:cytidine deaminase [Oscillospiraceae bacterium]